MSSILKVDTIQDQSGNNIINESGNVITIGASGDTITVPAGATVSGFTSAGIDDNATSVAITIDSNENVGIGSTAPSTDAWSGANSLVIKDTSGDNGLTIISSSATNNGNIAFADSSGGSFSDIGGLITYLHNGDSMRFMTANTERMRINSTGVGIGTSAPSTLLHLSSNTPILTFEETDQSNRQFQIGSFGNAYAINDATNSQFRYILDNSGNHIFNEGGADCDFRVESDANTHALFIEGSSGNVGIGTSSPDGILHLDNGATTKLIIEKDGGGAGSLIFHNDGSQTSYIQLDASEDMVHYGGSGVNQIFYASGSEKMRITSTGLGIGTSSPQSLLHVVGSSTSSQIIIENTDAGSAAAPDLFLYRNSSSPADSDSLGNIEFRGKNSAGAETRYVINNAKIIDASDGTEDGQIEWQLLNAGSFQKILTMNPTEVVINEDSADTNFRVESDSDANALFVDGGQNRIGVGTGNPQNKIDITATTWDDGLLIKNAGNFNTGIIADANRSGAGGGILNLASKWNGTEVAGILFQAGSDTTNKDDGEILFRTASAGTPTERMRITPAGRVGIGESSPDNALHVNSTSSTVTKFERDGGSNGSLTIGFPSTRANIESSGDMRLTANRIIINKSSAGSLTNSEVVVEHDGSSTYGIRINSTGTSGTQYHQSFDRGETQAGYITSNSATTIAFNNASDERLKENIENSGSAIQDIKDIKVRQFDWKDGIDTHRDFGFVAQELVNVVPEAVTQGTDELNDNGKPVRSWGVDYSHIVPRLVKVCQEQQTKIQELEARITTLEANN